MAGSPERFGPLGGAVERDPGAVHLHLEIGAAGGRRDALVQDVEIEDAARQLQRAQLDREAGALELGEVEPHLEVVDQIAGEEGAVGRDEEGALDDAVVGIGHGDVMVARGHQHDGIAAAGHQIGRDDGDGGFQKRRKGGIRRRPRPGCPPPAARSGKSPGRGPACRRRSRRPAHGHRRRRLPAEIHAHLGEPAVLRVEEGLGHLLAVDGGGRGDGPSRARERCRSRTG